jgi:hypothetical protein
MLSIVDAKPPSPAQLRSLSSSDLGVITWLVANFKERIREYVSIDPYTTRDPLEPNDDYDYSVVLDRKNLARVISLIAAKKDALPLPWSDIMADTLLHLQISKENASVVKYELMPKDNNNFYPYRYSTDIAGYIMFGSQICGIYREMG